MSKYLKIEWSGFHNFPDGNYQSGSKSGMPKSGKFNPNYINLEETGQIQYEVDPGKISMPSSIDWSFTLKNLHPETGNQMYPFEYISTLGRTEEYGGTFSKFGDLFIRATIPMLNDKQVYFGIVDNFSYTIHDIEVNFQCTSFINALKGKENSLFIKYAFENIDNSRPVYYGDSLVDWDYSIQSTETSTGDLVNSIFGVSSHNSFRDLNGDDLSLQSFEMIVDQTPAIQGASYQASEFDEQEVIDNQHAEQDQEYMDELFKSYENYYEIIERYEIDFFEPTWNEINPTGPDTWMSDTYEESTPWFVAFLQINESTILTQFRFKYSSRLGVSAGVSFIGVQHTNKLKIEIVHANNTDDDIERGKFDGIEFGEGQDINMYDLKRPTTSTVDESNTGYFIDDSFADFPTGEGVLLKSADIIHGVYFDDSSSDIKPYEYEGYFNAVQSIVYFVNKIIGNRFSDNQQPINMVDTTYITEDLFSYAYVMDLIHYGFFKGLGDLLVDVALQLSSLVYINESGSLEYRYRKNVLFKHTEDALGDSVRIYQEDYEIVSGIDYGYGSKYYDISYEDKIEINNVSGDDSVDKTIDSSGEIQHSVTQTQSLEIANYRTTNLAVPTELSEQEGYDGMKFRLSPEDSASGIEINKFIQLPINQAVNIAEGIDYPSEKFSIEIDLMYGEDKGYFGISIGSFVYEPNKDIEGAYNVFLVKKIAYSPKGLRGSSTSLKVELMFFTVYRSPVSESYSDEISISQDIQEGTIDPVEESYSDQIIISDESSEDTLDSVEESYEDQIIFSDELTEDSIESISESYSDSIIINDTKSEDKTDQPTTPQNLIGSGTDDGSGDYSLNWDGSSSEIGIQHYEIARNGSVFTTESSTSHSGTQGSEESNDYKVRAVDNNGLKSGWSNTVQISTEEPTNPPTAPSNLTGDGADDGSGDFSLDWDASSSQAGIDYYEIFKNDSIYSTATSSSFTGIQGAEETNDYKVRAVDVEDQVSDFSNEVSVQTTDPQSCFVEGTYITTAEGKKVPIELLEKGDKILGRNINSLEDSNNVDRLYRWVSDNIDGFNTEVEILSIEPVKVKSVIDINGSKIRASSPHTQLVERDGNWIFVPLSEVIKGDNLYTEDGDIISVESISKVKKESIVYKMTLKEPIHTFYANGVLTHNVK